MRYTRHFKFQTFQTNALLIHTVTHTYTTQMNNNIWFHRQLFNGPLIWFFFLLSVSICFSIFNTVIKSSLDSFFNLFSFLVDMCVCVSVFFRCTSRFDLSLLNIVSYHSFSLSVPFSRIHSCFSFFHIFIQSDWESKQLKFCMCVCNAES